MRRSLPNPKISCLESPSTTEEGLRTLDTAHTKPLTPERFRLMSELYDAAATLGPEERTCFIDERCANDDELRRELMAAFRDAGSTLAGVVGKAAERLWTVEITAWAAGWVSTIFSACWVKAGMGVVYEAEQDHPSRIVALKVIKAGVTSPQLLWRLLSEAR